MVRGNNKEGVFTQFGQMIVPVEYDKVEFKEHEPEIILTKNGKYGLIQIPLNHSVIEPKYDTPLSLEKTLNDEGKSFSLYKVKKKDGYVFVGQNGVEFFKN